MWVTRSFYYEDEVVAFLNDTNLSNVTILTRELNEPDQGFDRGSWQVFKHEYVVFGRKQCG